MTTESRRTSAGTDAATLNYQPEAPSGRDTEKNLDEAKSTLAGNATPIRTERSLFRFTLRQWVYLLSAWIVYINTWGLVLSFGVFQTYYEQELLHDKSSSDIAWVSTFCAWISVFAGLVTGPLFDRGYLRSLIFCGTLLQVFGMMMMSISTTYYQVFLSQGVCVGLAMALLYVPSLASVAVSFDVRLRPVVIGFVASGTGLGGVIYPIMFQRLIGPLGFAWTVRAMAFLVLGTYVLCWAVLYFPSKQPSTVRPWFDVAVLSDGPFILLMVGGFTYGMAYYLPLLFIPSFAQSLGSDNANLSLYLVAIINAVSFVCRGIVGFAAAKWGPTELTTFSLATSSIVLFCWAAVSTTTGVLVWTIFWGLSSSIVVATLGSVVPLFSPSLEIIGTRTGIYWAITGCGVLVGGPIGGALVDVHSADPHWWHVQVAAGMFMGFGALCYAYPLYLLRRRGAAAAGKA